MLESETVLELVCVIIKKLEDEMGVISLAFDELDCKVTRREVSRV